MEVAHTMWIVAAVAAWWGQSVLGTTWCCATGELL